MISRGISFIKRRFLIPVLVAGKPKIFCVGLNKTGTTSLTREMYELGFFIGSQMRGTRLIREYGKRNFKPIRKLVKSSQFFQDAPFSFPYTFIVMDQYFPKSKFILTVRDSPEQWYNSLTNFHSKLWGKDGLPPTAEELKNAPGPWPGIRYETYKILVDADDNDLYNEEFLKQAYLDYNKSVIDYFKHRPEDLLILNVAEKGAYKKLCNFLNIKPKKEDFAWENKT